jgi:hypothetical protein
MSFGRHKGMDRRAMWAELRRRGVAKVTVSFSGGGDEGGVDEISLQDAAGNEIGKLQEDYGGSTYDPKTGQWVPVNPPNPDTGLVEALVAPVYERYHSFAGDFYVSGTVDYDVQNEKALMNKSERVESYEDSDEEV